MTLLTLEKVTKTFGGLTAVDRVSLTVEPGEAVGIVGPNGSGKTTLFNVISGVYRPDAGRVFFEGQEITTLPPYRRAWLGIARTFQIPRPFSAATVQENVAVGAMFGRLGSKINVEEALKIADRYLELVGLSAKRHEISERLTSIEKKTMEIARALAMKPKLLLLDEVMAGMSPKDIDRVLQLLRQVKEAEGIAVVAMVEHIMRAVSGFAERVIVLHYGRKLLEAPTDEALRDPRVVEVYLGRSSAGRGVGQDAES
jgi:branched-chain amino acid transport system ATP-binding protein